MALRRVGAAGKGKQKELTEEQKQEIKEAFDLFDTDGSVRTGGGLRPLRYGWIGKNWSSTFTQVVAYVGVVSSYGRSYVRD